MYSTHIVHMGQKDVSDGKVSVNDPPALQVRHGVCNLIGISVEQLQGKTLALLLDVSIKTAKCCQFLNLFVSMHDIMYKQQQFRIKVTLIAMGTYHEPYMTMETKGGSRKSHTDYYGIYPLDFNAPYMTEIWK